jgi:pimeloyl-ACP methyl ester carboxylesterase
MAVVLVHGVPDTDHVWHRVAPLLSRSDVTMLRLPGFGVPLPPGFEPTHDAYAQWVAAQLATHTEPVDLVGHDWGAILALRAACLRPDVVRTWTVGAAPLDADYVWHPAAQAWQTPEVGERVMAKTTPEALAGALSAAGVPPDDAREAGARADDTMKRCILGLYRSGKNAGAEWGPELTRLPPRGLILWGELDPYAPPTWGERLAQRTGARQIVFPGCSHWWPLQRPAEVAAALRAH